MSHTIFLCSPDSLYRNSLRNYLEQTNHVVQEACSGMQVLQQIRCMAPAVVILDFANDLQYGAGLIPEIRKCGNPIVIVTGEAVARGIGAHAFRAGADDYIQKPIKHFDLTERIRQHLEARTRWKGTFTVGNAVVDLIKQAVFIDGRRESLTRQEARLLAALIQREGVPVPRKTLLEDAWGLPEGTRTRTLDLCISSVRRKLKESPRRPKFVLTVRGVGYQLVRSSVSQTQSKVTD